MSGGAGSSAAPADAAPVALVSGGSRGLGAALVEGFLRRGYRVATFSRRASPATAGWAGRDDVFWQAVDLADAAAGRDFVTRTLDRWGRVDVLVNNAGLGTAGVLPLMREAEIDRLLQVNLAAPLLLTQACSRAMLRQRGGAIINISSVNAIRGHEGVAVYSATKAALDGLTRSLARELGPRNIRVNAVAPGYFDSDMVQELTAEQRRRIQRRTPLGRLGGVEDVAAAVLFLASAEAAFITGHTLVVDGGITC